MPIQESSHSVVEKSEPLHYLQFMNEKNCDVEIYAQHLFSNKDFFDLSQKVEIKITTPTVTITGKTRTLTLPKTAFICPKNNHLFGSGSSEEILGFFENAKVEITSLRQKPGYKDSKDNLGSHHIYNKEGKRVLTITPVDKKSKHQLTFWERLQKSLKPLINP